MEKHDFHKNAGRVVSKQGHLQVVSTRNCKMVHYSTQCFPGKNTMKTEMLDVQIPEKSATDCTYSFPSIAVFRKKVSRVM